MLQRLLPTGDIDEASVQRLSGSKSSAAAAPADPSLIDHSVHISDDDEEGIKQNRKPREKIARLFLDGL